MDYFRILNLNKEPFSNSPEPEFFFESLQHRSCLQQLELAIRLRRGLNVVIGDVGTGKTTLCRQLILHFNASDDDRDHVETHLLMDPSFSTSIEFLTHVAALFGIFSASQSPTEWMYKEAIKKFLFHKGTEESKIIVLIVDEGQKLPAFCLEILREFLNYETNEAKLLQIVIFAQKEFQQNLKEQANFADRINLRYFLDPLSFGEMRKLIAYRIKKASNDGPAPKYFTYGALWALYLATGGYPRRIITLCHQLMLSLIIRSRTKVDWFMVRSCARRAAVEKPATLRLHRAALLGVFAVVALLIFIFYTVSREHVVSIGKIGSGPTRNVLTRGKEYSPAQPSVRQAISPASSSRKPLFLGHLTVDRGETVSHMLRRIYGNYSTEQMEDFLKANAHLIKDVNFVRAGEVVTVPARGQALTPLSGGRCWVQVASRKDLEAAYKFMKTNSRQLPLVRLFPYWNQREGLVFAVCMKESFADEVSASRIVKELPPDLAGQAKVVRDWGEGTEFYVSR